jgi:mono/diheme cytochrome c family protein
MIGRKAGAGLAGLVLGAAVAVPAAFGHGSAKVQGNPTAGKAIFVSNCSVCHTFKAAKGVGKNGPNLDTVKLSQASIIKQVTLGGTAVMGAAGKKFPAQMPGYKSSLSAQQIKDVSAFVYVNQKH